MKMTNTRKLLSIVVLLAMCVGLFAGCASTETTGTTGATTAATTTAATTAATTTEATTEATTTAPPVNETPLVVGYATFSEKFSPFFSDTAYDADVAAITQVGLLTTDRTGAIVYNAIEGETIPYNGTDYVYNGMANVSVNYDETADKTVYKWTIRDDIKFSDGTPLTADDIIFSYYVYSDATYTGSTTLYSVPIVGMKDYRTQTTSEVYDKYSAMFDAIYAAGEDHEWSDSDAWTQEQQTDFWALLKQTWTDDVQAIVDYVLANYMSYAEEYTGFTAEDIGKEVGLQVAMGMALWGFGEVDVEGGTKVLTTASGKEFKLADGEFPTIDDYYFEAYTKYEGDPEAYWGTEAADDTSVVDIARGVFIGKWGPLDESMGTEGIPSIAGIKKLSATEVEVTVAGFDATAIYNLGVSVSPLHYYGDIAKYDYENNKFGFDRNDLSGVASKTTMPMGAGPYKFIKFENKVVYFEANEFYYKGAPKTKNMQFKETTDADKISGIGTGTIDITDPSFSTAAVEEIKSYNANGEIVGESLVTNTVDNLGYGYIGMNSETMNVAGEPASDESKYLRKAIATVFSAYRELTVDSYYGERASVINYPISNTSWAAPQPTDDGYKVAFSTSVEGADIYTSDMNAEAKYAAALAAAVEYLKAAGFTFDEATGKFTDAPEGAKLEYEAVIGGEGKGDHPAFLLLSESKKALETIGITLTINDPTDTNVMWDKLDAGTQEIWVAAWGATIDPDMYQIYHSSNVIGEGGTDSNHYHIKDTDLDSLILEARKSDDQSFRKATYKACLDIIIDWAVEIPVYQRQNCILFSAERVNMDTVTPDITTFWGWTNDIELLEMN